MKYSVQEELGNLKPIKKNNNKAIFIGRLVFIGRR